MRICQAHYAFFPTTGGVESHLLDLSIEQVKQGHEVHALVGTLDGTPAEQEIQGVHVHRHELMNPEWVRDEKAKKNIAADEEDESMTARIRELFEAFIREHGIEVVHGHN